VIRLHLLGGLRLDRDHTGARQSVLSQPRRAALLAYLALRASHAPMRRDTLLGVFWPDSDADHARGALRNALHYLRVSLGPGVIESHGSEEVRIAPGALWCDAVEFERLCDAGDLAGALRLYAGDLLEGFFISEAPAFEAWLELERTRLRQRAADAARTLAGEAEEQGEAGVAALRLRDVLRLAPTEEESARRLMRLLSAADDRGAALRVYGELEERLDRDYGLEPAEETRELADSIRGGNGLRPAPVARPAGGGETATRAGGGTATLLEAPPGPAPAHRAAPAATTSAATAPGPRRFPRHAAVIGAATLGALVVAVILLLRPALPATSPDLVAVLPFEYRGAAEHAYLAEGLADLLAANLHGAGELRAVDPRAFLPRLDGVPHPIQPVLARREAAVDGAGLFVLGSVTEAAGQLRITAALYDATSRSGSTTVVTEGSVDDVIHLVDRVTMALLEGRGATPLAEAALRTTHSIEALKAFLRGEAALRRADVHGAIEHYRRATDVDSTFALAHYRLSSAAYRQGISRIPRPSATAALRHAGRLAREDSLLVAAWHNHVIGSIPQAFGLYREALVTRPSHIEAAFQLGELLFHWGALIGAPAADAAPYFERVLDAEPVNVQAALHLARLAAREGDRVRLDALVAQWREAEPDGSWQTELGAVRAFLGDDLGAQEAALAAAGTSAGRIRMLFEAVAAYTGNLAAVERELAGRAAARGDPVEQAMAQLFLAQVQLARGRYRAATAGIAEAPALHPALRLEYRAMLASLPFLPLPADELTRVRAELAAHPDLDLQDEGGPIAGPGVEYPHLLWPGLFRPRRLYLLGALHVQLGELAAASAVADTLAAYAPTEWFADRYGRLTRARLALAQGQASAGLRALGPVQPPLLRTRENLVDYGRVYERWLRAELLRASGRITEAARWYATFPDPSARDLVYLAPAHLRRAQIHDDAGDHAQAARHYQRFVALWSDADPELQPEVERARLRLRELR
jgi:DNA-binding SARP family transcriptional activator/TolB-like protein